MQQSIDNRQRDLPTSLTLEERHQIEDQVWEELIQNRVLETEYERRGISVSTDEIVQAIRNSPPADFRNVPEFQTDSQFDIEQVPALAHLQRGRAVSPGAGGAVPRPVAPLQAPPRGGGRHLPVGRRALGAVP